MSNFEPIKRTKQGKITDERNRSRKGSTIARKQARRTKYATR